MIAVTTSPPHISIFRKYNTWYTIKDGNWSDPTIWESNGSKRHSYPQAGDTVYVNHVVAVDVNPLLNNLYISGTIKSTSVTAFVMTVNGDCQVYGTGAIDLSLQSNNLVLNGYNNVIPSNSFIGGNYSTVIYNGVFSQTILNISYRNLTTSNTGLKFQVSDITLSGNFNQQSNYEVSAYNLTVNGNSILGSVGQFTFSKNSGIGSILFIGNADFEGTTNLSGNPNVEFRGGITIHTFNLTTGSGVFKFTTNNQIINSNAYLGGSWNASVIIQGAITITVVGGSPLQINNTINGTVTGSTLNNSGILYLGVNSIPMTTGAFNYQYTATSILGYSFNGNYSLPYTSYAGLYLNGTGTKTLSGNTTLTYNFLSDGNFETNGFNLNVSGTTTNSGLGKFTVSSFSTLLFMGAVNWASSNGYSGVDFSLGNPNAEFRNGLIVYTTLFNTGTGIFKFTTNNQTLSYSAFNGGTCSASFLISGAISLTFLSGANLVPFAGILNGDATTSTFNNQGNCLYSNPQQPMQTGILVNTSASSIFNYSGNLNQDITGGTYKNLTLSAGGVKKLLGNVSVLNTYTLSAPAAINLNGFLLTNP